MKTLSSPKQVLSTGNTAIKSDRARQNQSDIWEAVNKSARLSKPFYFAHKPKANAPERPHFPRIVRVSIVIASMTDQSGSRKVNL